MKIAFSTIACPTWELDEIIAAAKDLGYDGVEIRGIGDELYAPNIEAFSDAAIAKTIEDLEARGIAISCISSGACLAIASRKEENLAEGKAYIDLACKLHCDYIRVMPTDKPYNEGGDLEEAKEVYTELCKYGKDKSVTPLMETNGIFADTKVLKEFLDGIDCDNKGALYDVNHPYRYNRESVRESISNLSKYIKYVHFKDSAVVGGEVQYRMTGYGDYPTKELLSGLKNIGYDGYITLEWVKRWHKNLDEPTVSIPLYASFMNNLK